MTGYFTISLLSGLNGKIYGINSSQGPNNSGVLFEFDPVSGALLNKVNFDYNNNSKGYIPSGMIKGVGEKFYGLVNLGYQSGKWVVFEFDSSTGSYSILDTASDGDSIVYPYGYLVFLNGKLYGRQNYYAGKKRVIFEFDLTTKKVINKSVNDGVFIGSDSRLSISSDGMLYGFEKSTGLRNNGYLFKYDLATSTEQKLFDFTTVSNGSKPAGMLTKGANGKLFGVTQEGGNFGYGTLFEYDPVAKQLTKKFDFPTDYKSGPSSTLALAPNGKFYGVTGQEPVELNAHGTIFEYDPASERVEKIYDFDIKKELKQPMELTVALNGKLYGVAVYGGIAGGGIFELDPATKVFTKKHDFDYAEGYYPLAALTVGPNGKLYGTCSSSSSANNYAGTLFEYNYETNQVLN